MADNDSCMTIWVIGLFETGWSSITEVYFDSESDAMEYFDRPESRFISDFGDLIMEGSTTCSKLEVSLWNDREPSNDAIKVRTIDNSGGSIHFGSGTEG